MSALVQSYQKRWILLGNGSLEAFEKFKKIMSSPQVLALPNFNQPFELECDASNNGIRAVLQQNNRPITFTTQA